MGMKRPAIWLLCSYCSMTFKMLKKMDDWTLVEDFEE